MGEHIKSMTSEALLAASRRYLQGCILMIGEVTMGALRRYANAYNTYTAPPLPAG